MATFTKIADYTLPSNTTTYTFNNLGTYSDLFVVANVRCTGTPDRNALALRFNESTVAEYTYKRMYYIGDTNAKGVDYDTGDRLLLGYIPSGGIGPSNYFSATTIYIPSYRDSNLPKPVLTDSSAIGDNKTKSGLSQTSGIWANNSPINSVTFGTWDNWGSAQLVQNSNFTIYGIQN